MPETSLSLRGKPGEQSVKQRMAVLIAALFILAASGFITAILSGNELADVLPFLIQTSDPEANPLRAEPWQAEQIFLLIGFILFNMIGIGATIAVVMWLLHRGVREVHAEEVKMENTEPAEAEAG